MSANGAALLSSVRIGGSGNDGVNIQANYAGDLTPISIRRNYGDDARSEIILDRGGNPILASATQSSNFPVTAGVFQSQPAQAVNNRYQDGVVMKLTPDLNTMLFSSYLGVMEMMLLLYWQPILRMVISMLQELLPAIISRVTKQVFDSLPVKEILMVMLPSLVLMAHN